MESIDKIKRLADIVSKNTAPSSNTNTLIGNLLKAMALYMAEQHHGAVGGYQFLNSIEDLPTGDLTDKQKRTGYVVGENIYFYVGTDGDTLDGEYQNGGSFHGTKGDDGLSAYEIWKAIDPNNANKTEGEFLASLKQSGIGYDYALTQSAATTDNTIYAIPDEEDENYWYEYYRKNGNLYFLGKHQGGLGGVLTEVDRLKNDINTAKTKVSKTIRDLDNKLDKQEVEGAGFLLSNGEGDIFMRYDNNGLDAEKVNSHFKELVAPDLSDYAKKNDIPEQVKVTGDTEEDGIFFTDNEGRVFLKYDNENGLDANKVSEHFKGLVAPSTPSSSSDIMKEVDESGAFFVGADGKAFAKYDDIKGFDVNKVSKHFKGLVNLREVPYVKGFVETLTEENSIELDLPDCKYNQTISFSAFVDNAAEIGELIINRGFGYAAIGSTKISINSERVEIINATSDPIITLQHGLTIKDFLIVNIKVGIFHAANYYGSTINIITNDSSHPNGFLSNIIFRGSRLGLTAQLEGQNATLRSCILSWGCSDLLKPLWCFGDSYFDYWPTRVIGLGYGNAMFDGFGGRQSVRGLASLKTCLSLAKPKSIFWCMGANDPDVTLTIDETLDGVTPRINTNWLDCYNELTDICKENGIELILYTVHNGIAVSNNTLRISLWKNELIRNSGYRYIDVYAICKDPNKSIDGKENGRFVTDFYDGMNNPSDLVHPNAFGANIIAHYIAANLPELKDEVNFVVKDSLSSLENRVSNLENNN